MASIKPGALHVVDTLTFLLAYAPVLLIADRPLRHMLSAILQKSSSAAS